MLNGLIVNIGLLCGAAAIVFLVPWRLGLRMDSRRRSTLIGLVMGAVAVLLVNSPVTIAEGATFDTRAGPAVLAGLFGGPIGAGIAATIGGLARLHVGGPAALGGTASFYLYGLVGCAAAVALRRSGRKRLGAAGYAALAMVATIAVLPSFFIGQPVSAGWAILGAAWYLLVIGNVCGITLLGLMHNELFRIRQDELELRLKSQALDCAPLGVVIAEAGGDQPIVYVNQGFQAITGYRSDEAIGHNCRFLNQGQPDQPELEAMRVALRDKQSCDVVLRNWRADGIEYRSRVVLRPITDEDGETAYYIGTLDDVTERWAIQREIESTRDRLNIIVSSAPDAIVTVNADQRITSFNQAAERLFGWNREDIEGQHLAVLVPEHARDDHARNADGYLGNEHSATRPMAGLRIIEALRQDGGTFPALVTFARFLDEDGRPAVAAIARDMTEFVRTNQSLVDMSGELRKQLETVKAANAAKSRFLAHMSHELRTPLNAIIGFAEMMKLEVFGPHFSPKYSDYAQNIHSSGRHLLTIVNDVLDLSRIDHDAFPIQLEPVPAIEPVRSAVRSLEPLAASKGLTLHVRGAPAGAALIDRRAMQQCLTNVLSNAVKFSPKQSHILVTADVIDDQVEYRVVDSGPGIDPSILARIGEHFVTSEEDGGDRDRGVGLGLSIVKALIERMGGTLEMRNRTEGGAMAVLRVAHVAETVPASAPADEEFATQAS